MLAAPRRCAKCKDTTNHLYVTLEDYVEVRCEVCGQPSKRITHEKILERLQAALCCEIVEDET